MLLPILLAAPFAAALLAAFASSKDGPASARMGLVLSLAVAALAVPLVTCMPGLSFSEPWFTLWGTGAVVSFSLASDGLSAWLIQLVTVLTPIAILASRDAAGDRIREFVVAALVMEGLMIGALLARDLVLFYVFFEGMLVPMVVLTCLFGGSDRRFAALQFFIYTMFGSIFMLVGIWFIAWKLDTTSLAALIDGARLAALPAGTRTQLFFAFCLAFAVKVPLMPLHGWQAQIYAEAPAGAALLLAGAMAKIGAYGFLRFVLPLFPGESATHAQLFMVLGLVGVVAGALMALAQTDAKRLIAFSSLSHLGLVIAGIFSFEPMALSGAAVQMVAHGLSVAALFLLVGVLERHTDLRGIDAFGGLAGRAPLFAVLFVAAALASAALPGTANFAGEFMILLGLSRQSWMLVAIAGLGTILSAIYLLRWVQRWLYGPRPRAFDALPDLTAREAVAVGTLLALSLGFGFYPRPIASQAGVAAIALAEPARVARAALLAPAAPAAPAAATASASSGDPHASR